MSKYKLEVSPGKIRVSSIRPIWITPDVLIFYIDCNSKRPEVDPQGMTLSLDADEHTLRVDDNFDSPTVIEVTMDGEWESLAGGGKYAIIWVLYRQWKNIDPIWWEGM